MDRQNYGPRHFLTRIFIQALRQQKYFQDTDTQKAFQLEVWKNFDLVPPKWHTPIWEAKVRTVLQDTFGFALSNPNPIMPGKTAASEEPLEEPAPKEDPLRPRLNEWDDIYRKYERYLQNLSKEDLDLLVQCFGNQRVLSILRSEDTQVLLQTLSSVGVTSTASTPEPPKEPEKVSTPVDGSILAFLEDSKRTLNSDKKTSYNIEPALRGSDLQEVRGLLDQWAKTVVEYHQARKLEDLRLIGQPFRPQMGTDRLIPVGTFRVQTCEGPTLNRTLVHEKSRLQGRCSIPENILWKTDGIQAYNLHCDLPAGTHGTLWMYFLRLNTGSLETKLTYVLKKDSDVVGENHYVLRPEGLVPVNSEPSCKEHTAYGTV